MTNINLPVVDFSDVEETSFEPVPVGEYVLEVEETEIKTGRESGIPYINMRLNIAEGPYSGKKIFDILSFSHKALFKMKNFLLAAGMTEEELAGQQQIDPDSFIGVTLSAQVKIRSSEQFGDKNEISKYIVPTPEVGAGEEAV